jgi:hypothetical protein
MPSAGFSANDERADAGGVVRLCPQRRPQPDGSRAFVVAAAAPSGTRPSITAVKVSGSSSHPVFTVTGHGLTVPKPNPATSPSGRTLCPIQISGNAGLDYGNSFFVNVWDGSPLGTNAQMYAGGRYRPTLNELDCIGLIVLKHSPGQIVFTFGHGYQQYYSAKPRFIRNGDVILVGVGPARFATVVHF